MKPTILLVLTGICCLGAQVRIPGPGGESAAVSLCIPASGYSHCGVFSVGPTPSVLTNFPVVTKTVGSLVQLTGVQSANCSDVIATSDSSGATKVPWEVAHCSGSGMATVELWTSVTTSTTLATKYYLSWGNASITTAQNTGALSPDHVWSFNYKGVWHVGNGAALSLADSTVNAAAGTNGSATATTGQMDGGLATTGGSYSTFPFPDINFNADWTLSMWLQQDNSAGYNAAFDSAAGDRLMFDSAGAVSYNGGIFAGLTAATNGLTVGSLHYLVLVHSSSALTTSYVDGSFKETVSNTTSRSALNLSVAKDITGGGTNWQGKYDEIRHTNNAPNAAWISAEYNNQGSGSLVSWSLF